MSIYDRIRKLYEEERARQQRETELLRAASKVADALHGVETVRVADALHAHGVEPVDVSIRGWLIHLQILPASPTPPPRPTAPRSKPGQGFVIPGGPPTFPTSTTVQDTMVRYHLGEDGRIYRNGKPIDHPGNATIDEVEQYLAEIVVKNHLDPELFKDDDVQG